LLRGLMPGVTVLHEMKHGSLDAIAVNAEFCCAKHSPAADASG